MRNARIISIQVQSGDIRLIWEPTFYIYLKMIYISDDDLYKLLYSYYPVHMYISVLYVKIPS